MSKNSKIEWTDHTFNPWIGCKAISPGCANCYAADWAKRYGRDFAERTRTKTWAAPLKWNAEHEAFFAQHGRRQRVFCASLADVFDNEVDPEWRADLFALMRATPNLDWLLLTKRIGMVLPQFKEAGMHCNSTDRGDLAFWIMSWFDGRPPANVWLGATVVNQEEADRDIPKLIATPAAKRFLSIEPMLGPMGILKWLDAWTCADCEFHGSENDCGPDGCEKCGKQDSFDGDTCKSCGADDQSAKASCPQCGSHRSYERDNGFKFDSEKNLIDWVIAGGESGPGARPSHPDWFRSLRDQCAAAGVPFLFKQHGEWANSEAAALDLNDCYEVSKIGGWVEPDGKVTLGEGAAPFSEQAAHVFKIGKKAAGRLLDGIEHNGFPA